MKFTLLAFLLWFLQASVGLRAEGWWAARPIGLGLATEPHSVDGYIRENLQAHGLTLGTAAAPRDWLRRVAYDLTGLPPTPQEMAAYLHAVEVGGATTAQARAIEQYLDSPAYGQHWGRHWLDVVRYADSLDARSLKQAGDISEAWRYRDWVVAAWQEDLPYPEFIRQQIAGDILAAQSFDARKLVATGLYAIGNWGNGDSDKQKEYADLVDDQIDVTSRAFLGITMSCARCHDHKFDPLTTQDYYALAGFFYSSHIIEKFADPTAGEAIQKLPLLAPAQQAERVRVEAQMKETDARLSRLTAARFQPFTETTETPGSIISWRGKTADNPSLTINRSGQAAKFSTVELPAAAICVHPGPEVPVSICWQAPAGLSSVRLELHLKDVDATCGDGIQWSLRADSQVLAEEMLDNGKAAELVLEKVSLPPGGSVVCVIQPRGEYTCDSTQVTLRITSGDQVWELAPALVAGWQQGVGAWTIGAGANLTSENAEPEVAALTAQRAALAAQLPPLEMCVGLQEGGVSNSKFKGFQDVAIQERGRYDQLGAVVARNVPVVLRTEEMAPISAGSGRLELANWIASAGNPLTARVLVNRLWQHHFGKGLVATTNNFGKLGSGVSHPALLDWLAAKFIASGWSIKAMHRLILSSATYGQSAAEHDPVGLEKDPQNQWLWHQQRHRLGAEELRDSLLAVSGRLDRTLGGDSVADVLNPRRSLYLTTVRSERSSFLLLFDGADPTSIVEQRNESTVAPQALWLLNHPLVLAQAQQLAERVLVTVQPLEMLYQQVFQRAPTAAEVSAAAPWVAAKDYASLAQVLMCSNEFIYLD